MAPEIRLGMKYNGQSVDLFAAAIVLFIMHAGTPAFISALPSDPYYRLICTNKHQDFWTVHQAARSEPYSSEFKDLMNGLLAFDPVQRPSLAEIKNHPWYLGELPTREEIVAEFGERYEQVRQK